MDSMDVEMGSSVVDTSPWTFRHLPSIHNKATNTFSIPLARIPGKDVAIEEGWCIGFLLNFEVSANFKIETLNKNR